MEINRNVPVEVTHVIHRGLVDDEEDLIQKNAIVSYIGRLLQLFLSFLFI